MTINCFSPQNPKPREESRMLINGALIFYFIAGVISAIAILFLLAKLNIRRVLAFDIAVDIVASLTLMLLFAGTFAGMMVAIVAGALISIVLFFLKKIGGYERPKRKGYWFEWEYVPPKSKS